MFGQTKAEYYSCIPRVGNFTGGLTVRDWLTGQPYDDQHRFGSGVMNCLGSGLPDRMPLPAGLEPGVLTAYRGAITGWEADRELAPWHTYSAAWTAQTAALDLVSSSAGQQALEGLLSDRSPAVRLAAAVETSRWNRKRSEKVVEDAARHDRGIYGFEAQVVLEQLRSGRLDLDWRSRRSDSGPTYLATREDEANALLAVYSTVMSGGFHYAIAAFGPLMLAAAAGFESCRLAGPAELVLTALRAMPWESMPREYVERSDMVRRLPEPINARLESLANDFQESFPRDSVLLDAMFREGDAT